MCDSKYHRPVRSFVLREGRLTPGQQRAFEQHWQRFGIDFAGDPLPLEQLYPSPQPLYLEVGFGNGESLVRMAAAAPEKNFLGIEVHRPGVGRLLMRAAELDLHNLRAMRHDAVEVLDKGLADASLDGFFLFFPDPWHKKRHHKRRIFQASLIERLHLVLKPGGIIHAATDWEDYARWMMNVMRPFEDRFENLAGPGNFSPRPDYRPITKFEQRGERLGHGVWDLLFRKIK